MLQSRFQEKNGNAILPEYPRMQMQRDSYMNLNGAWEYQITERKADPTSEAWKPITVPFALGTPLSGTSETLPAGKTLWYRKQFAYKPNALHTWLNFEAVDMECTVFVNGLEVGTHKGGYTPFGFEITQYVKYQNSLLVRIIDDTERGKFAYGKQLSTHGGMWYTPSAGIWGTVWIEDIADHAIKSLRIDPDFDGRCVHVALEGDFEQALVTVSKDGHVLHSGITLDKHYTAPIEEMHPWSPDDPYLYDLYVSTDDDVVRSYFGMRKFTISYDSQGIMRFCLNNRPLFLSGVLDQGISCDGFYTYPSDEAILYEMSKVRGMGFNMIRKHVKVESRRWYYDADKMGILVMQDIPNGGNVPYDLWKMGVLPNLGFRHMKDTEPSEYIRTDETSKKNYYTELNDIIQCLYNVTSIFCWVPFNEGWGQFDAEKVTQHIKTLDPGRIVDSASGWHDQNCGDVLSIHNYFFPFHAHKDKHGRVLMLTEFGGYAYLEQGHSEPKKLYGYKKFKDKIALDEAVGRLYETKILPNIKKGLSGCVYTQLTDVQDECNGLLTADRKVVKIDERKMRKINEKCIRRIKK